MENQDKINVLREEHTTIHEIPEAGSGPCPTVSELLSNDEGGQDWPTPVTSAPLENLYEFEYYRRLDAEREIVALEATVQALGKELFDVEETCLAELEAASMAAEVAEEQADRDCKYLNDTIDHLAKEIAKNENELSELRSALSATEDDYATTIDELYESQKQVENLLRQLADQEWHHAQELDAIESAAHAEQVEACQPMVVRETVIQPKITVKQPSRLQRAAAKLAKFRMPKFKKQARISVLDDDPIR